MTWVPRERVQHRTAEKKEVAPHPPEETIEAVRRSRCSYSMIGNVPSHHFPDDKRVFSWRRTMKVCPLPPSHWRHHWSSPSNKRLAENESLVLNLWNLRNRTRRCARAALRWQVRSNVPGVKQLLLRTQHQIWKLVHFSEARIADFHVRRRTNLLFEAHRELDYWFGLAANAPSPEES